jgi:hypothetical protein
MIRRAAVLLAVVGALVLAWTGPAAAILHGRPDGGAHPYVGLVTDGGVVCSGSAVSPTVFLTAAHCFAHSGEQVKVTFDPQGLQAGGAVFHPGTWYRDPAFCLRCSGAPGGVDSHDVAVVLLGEPVSLGSYAALPRAGQSGTLPLPHRITLVGYGVQDTPGSVAPGEAYSRHRAVAELVRGDGRASGEFLEVSADPARGEGTACFGDSGGPILLGATVLGVNSFVTDRQCAGPSFAYRIDTPEALAFIRSVVAGHS